MNDYDFSTLNDKEFENLTIDLISRDRGKRFERFKAGRDGGIDGRYYGGVDKEEIIQCKHYLKTGYGGLISSLKKKNNGKNEVDKVKILNPEKYIFVTSLPLSAANKKEIKKLFEPYIKNDSDIYGQEDLNDLLKTNPDIEEIYYKLWISSTTVLQRIFNNAIKGRSDFLLEEIKDKIKYYVITENHNKAIKKLEESHTIIIAGEPGIGKTTLAEQVSLYYIEKGFEFCVIAKDIDEAEDIFEKNKKQIFYFDDFLGNNYLSALESNTDSQIMQFITRVKKDKNKRFILTSRTNILNQGISLYDNFRTKKLDSDEFIIKVEDLQPIDKAKILYNHIWHSNLSEEYIDEVYKDKRYRIIINHRNFNPRLIEFVTDIDRIKTDSVTNYWQDIQNNLDNPSEIWANTFDKQSDDYIRNIVSLVVFNGNTIKENELKEAYYRLNNLLSLQNSGHISKDFDSIIKDTVKYFLNRRLKCNVVEYSLYNPSVADFIINRYKNNEEKIMFFLLSLKNLASLEYLRAMKIFSTVSEQSYNNVLKKLYKKIDIQHITNAKEIDYIILLIDLLKYSDVKKDKIINFFKYIISKNKDFTLIKEFIDICIWKLGLYEDEIYVKNEKFVINLIENSSLDIDTINSIIEFINYFEIKNNNISIHLNNLVKEYLEIELKNKIEDISYDISDINLNFNNDEILDIIKNKIYNYIDELVNEINIFDVIVIDKHEIFSIIDIYDIKEEIVEQYSENSNNVYHNKRIFESNSNNDEIEDLFERA